MIDISKKARAGIERYSLDMQPQLGKNNKMRLYVDWADNTITVVPMFLQEKGKGCDQLSLYKNSAARADACWPEISNVLGLGKLLSDQAECRLLFGAKHVDEITEKLTLHWQFRTEKIRKIFWI